MAQGWSHQWEERFHLRLPPDLVAWLDDELWERGWSVGLAEFTEPHLPSSESQSPAVWGGGMLPDSLPILGNGCGDCLCLRFHPDGTVFEVVRWSHEGAFWTPYGKTLSEALLFDAATGLMSDAGSDDADLKEDLADWALRWVGPRLGEEADFRKSVRRDNALPIEVLLDASIAESACHRALCERCLESGLARWCRTFWRSGTRPSARGSVDGVLQVDLRLRTDPAKPNGQADQSHETTAP